MMLLIRTNVLAKHLPSFVPMELVESVRLIENTSYLYIFASIAL